MYLCKWFRPQEQQQQQKSKLLGKNKIGHMCHSSSMMEWALAHWNDDSQDTPLPAQLQMLFDRGLHYLTSAKEPLYFSNYNLAIIIVIFSVTKQSTMQGSEIQNFMGTDLNLVFHIKDNLRKFINVRNANAREMQKCTKERRNESEWIKLLIDKEIMK